jgi:hypothetical protein
MQSILTFPPCGVSAASERENEADIFKGQEPKVRTMPVEPLKLWI